MFFCNYIREINGTPKLRQSTPHLRNGVKGRVYAYGCWILQTE